MVDAVSEFRQLFFVYCLDSQRDGSYVVLNRHYKPLGLYGGGWVDYENFPIRFKFKRALSARQIAALSCKGDASAERIYLYSDGSIPTSSDEAWAAYCARLRLLAGHGMVGVGAHDFLR